MTKILIVDDEAHCRNVLIKHLSSFNEIELSMESADDVEEGLAKINSFNPDILLLDIRMNQGTGFDLLDRTDSSKFQIIFTTAYNQYAIKAFEYSAIHYLLKPIDKKELANALKRCESDAQFIDNQQVDEIKNLLISTEKLELKAGIEEICYIKAEGSYSKIYLTNGRDIITSKNIGEYESLLPTNFFRTHRSFLINLNHVKQVKSSSDAVDTFCTENLPISKRKKSEFRKAWNNIT